MKRARLIAVLTARWNGAQLPERLRLWSLPCGVHNFFSVATSLKSTKAGRGQPSFVQKRPLRLRPLPSFLRIIGGRILEKNPVSARGQDRYRSRVWPPGPFPQNALSFHPVV